MIVKFSDWQGASGIRRACVLSGVGVDGHMVPGCTLHCFSVLIIVLHIRCVMCTSVALLVLCAHGAKQYNKLKQYN